MPRIYDVIADGDAPGGLIVESRSKDYVEVFYALSRERHDLWEYMHEHENQPGIILPERVKLPQVDAQNHLFTMYPIKTRVSSRDPAQAHRGGGSARQEPGGPPFRQRRLLLGVGLSPPRQAPQGPGRVIPTSLRPNHVAPQLLTVRSQGNKKARVYMNEQGRPPLHAVASPLQNRQRPAPACS